MKQPSVRWALASLALSMLMPSLDTSIANAALPALAQAFSASFQDVQWIVLAYLLSVTTMIVSAGRLGDAMGRRRVLLAGIGVFTVASLLCGVAPTLGMLLAARFAQGLGAAVMMALAVAFVGDTVPKARVGSAMGLLGTMSAVGTTLGPSLGGLLIAGFDWRAIFLVNVPVGLLTLGLAYRHLPVDALGAGDPKPEAVRFDTLGTLLLALTLAAYALAMTLGRGHFGLLNIVLLLATLCGAGLIVHVERRAASPLIPVATFRDPALRAGLVMSAIVFAVMMTTLVVGPFYLVRSLGLSTVGVGAVLSAGPLVASLTGVPAGRIVDRFGARRVTIAGLAGITLGASLLCLLPERFGVAGYIAPIVVMTASYALFQAANNTALMTIIRPEQRGAMSGMLGLSRNLGLMTGASVMGAVFAAAGMRFTFGVAAVLIAVALVIAVRIHSHPPTTA